MKIQDFSEINKFAVGYSEWVWDKWQQEVLDYQGNITIRAGRQCGKSVVMAEKVCRFAIEHPDTIALVLAASQRQSGLLFEKIKNTLEWKGVEFAEPPTLTKIVLKNGSKIYSLPAGKTGVFIRGFTVDLLVVDECAYVPEVVFNSIIPMIAVSRQTRGFGWIFLLSTPVGKVGYFYRSFTDDEFKSWHVSSEDCPRIPKEMLKKERQRLSRREYAQEWKGEFVDDVSQMFTSDLLHKSMNLVSWEKADCAGDLYLGVDVARYGGDENAFVIVELQGSGANARCRAVKCDVTDHKSIVDTVGRVIAMNKEYGFKKIFVDDTGIGGGVTDFLQDKLGRKVFGINNAAKRLEVQGKEVKRGILKEDLYSNVLVMLEQGRLELINDVKLLRSLKSITFAYNDQGGRVYIFGNYSHLAEALVRACWCVKERGLNIYCF